VILTPFRTKLISSYNVIFDIEQLRKQKQKFHISLSFRNNSFIVIPLLLHSVYTHYDIL